MLRYWLSGDFVEHRAHVAADVSLQVRGQPVGLGPLRLAWFAGGDRAYGLICAWGAMAVAPVSVGSTAVGLIAIGNLSVGLFSVGTVAVGWLAIGCASIGVKAFAWLSALGSSTAAGGGFAIAQLAAGAPVAFAEHANDDAARAIFASAGSGSEQLTFITTITVLSLIPIIGYAYGVRKRLGQNKKPS